MGVEGACRTCPTVIPNGQGWQPTLRQEDIPRLTATEAGQVHVHCMPNPNVTTELGTFLGRIRADIQLRAVDGGFNGLPVDRPLTFWAWISYV